MQLKFQLKFKEKNLWWGSLFRSRPTFQGKEYFFRNKYIWY